MEIIKVVGSNPNREVVFSDANENVVYAKLRELISAETETSEVFYYIPNSNGVIK